MRAADYIGDIAGSFAKQRLRTVLTATGIGIGAFAITLMVGLAHGLQSYLEEQFLAFHDERVLIVYPEALEFGERFLKRLTTFGRPAQPITARDEEARRIRRGGLWITPEQAEALRALPDVQSVSPLTALEADGVALADDGVFYEIDFVGVTSSPLVGTPSAGSVEDAAVGSTVLLSAQYATSFRLHPDELVGREVVFRVPKLSGMTRRFSFRDPADYKDEYRLFPATVVGLSEKSPISKAAYASLHLAREMARYQSGNPEFLSDEKLGSRAHVRLKGDASIPEAKQRIAELGLRARSLDDDLSEIRKVFVVVNAVLTSFGLLALVVATLGIANTLLMAITERTHEIGIMKALGMTEATVRRLFALEAATIGLVGGLGGTLGAVVIGIAANVLAKRIPAAEVLEGYSVFAYPAWLLLGAPAFCSLVGGLAGIYPAKRAARLDPIAALRHE